MRTLALLVLIMMLGMAYLAMAQETMPHHCIREGSYFKELIKEERDVSPKLIKKPRVVLPKSIAPIDYPTGRIICEVLVNEQGYPECVDLLKVEPYYHPATVSAILDAIYQAQWEPRCNEYGQPVPFYAHISFNIDFK